MKTILHSLRIHASPEDVFDALTTEVGLAGWWSTVVKAGTGVGGHVRFTFHGDFHPVMQVTALVPARKVGWRCVDGHDKWLDNTFSFTLDPREGETQLEFVQEYARELSNEDYGTYNFNWGYYLNSLKLLCETGEGTPFESPAR